MLYDGYDQQAHYEIQSPWPMMIGRLRYEETTHLLITEPFPRKWLWE